MPFNLVIVVQSPYQGRKSHETLEAIMSLALFEIEHKVVFFDEGLYWLNLEQKPDAQKSLEKQLSALPMYGSEELFYVNEHKIELLPNVDLHEAVSGVTSKTLSEWFKQAAHVEVM